MPYRFALLAFFLAAPALAQTGATPAEEEPTTIDAERIEGVGDLEVTAHGDAEIRQGDFSVFGDVLRYNREFGRAQAEGGVRMQRGF